MKFASSLIFLFVAVFASAQVQLNARKIILPEFGDIDEETLKMKSCAFEQDAPAMILFDYRKTSLESDGYVVKMITERRVRIKVFSEKGFKHANITIPYINRKRDNRIEDISAITYNIDESGNVLKEIIEKKQIFKEKSDETVRTVKFAFPGVKAGSVIEYRYTQVQKRTVRIEPWLIQTSIPVQSRILELEVPLELNMETRKLNTLPLETKDTIVRGSYGSSNLLKRFYAKDVRSFSPEPYMSSLIDNMHRVEFRVRGSFFFSLSASRWDIINDELNDSKNFGFWIKAKITGTNSLIDSAKKIADTVQRIKYLFDEVKSRIKWDGETEFLVDNLTDCWNTKSGNSAEINLLLTNLLLKSGVYCIPTLVSTRENGKVNKEYVRLSQFNSIVVWVPNEQQTLILDATRKHLSYNTTPAEVLNRNAFAVDTAAGQWIYISDNRMLDRVAINMLASLDSTENLIGEAAVFLYDHTKEAELISREKAKEDKDEEEEERTFTISDYKEENVNDPSQPLTEKFKFKSSITHTGNLYYFHPLFLTSFKENPFVASERQTDVDMGANQLFALTMVLTLPENFEAEFVPGNIMLRSEDSSILFKRINAIEQKKVVLKCTLEIHQTIFTKDEYPALRDFYKKLFALLKEQIVLKKIN